MYSPIYCMQRYICLMELHFTPRQIFYFSTVSKTWYTYYRIMQQRSRRWRSWKKFRETGLPRDYDAYKIYRNKLKDLIQGQVS